MVRIRRCIKLQMSIELFYFWPSDISQQPILIIVYRWQNHWLGSGCLKRYLGRSNRFLWLNVRLRPNSSMLTVSAWARWIQYNIDRRTLILFHLVQILLSISRPTKNLHGFAIHDAEADGFLAAEKFLWRCLHLVFQKRTTLKELIEDPMVCECSAMDLNFVLQCITFSCFTKDDSDK